MEERLNNQRPMGLTSAGLKTFAMVFIALGIVGRCIFQNGMLGMNSSTGSDLMELIMASEDAMIYATVAIVLQVLECMAVPLVAYQLVEGFRHTSSFKNYILRLGGLALVCELPYNLAVGGKLLDMGSRNPVFGLVLTVLVLYFYNRYQEKSFNNLAIKFFVTLAAFIWVSMLKIENGEAVFLIAAVLWAFRNKPTYRNFVGCSAAICCCLFSSYFLIAPLSFLILHYYNEEKGEENRLVQYLAYPVILLAVGLVGQFLM